MSRMRDDHVDDGAQILVAKLYHINLHLRSLLAVDNQVVEMPVTSDVITDALVNCDLLNGRVWHCMHREWHITLADVVLSQLYSDGPKGYWQRQESQNEEDRERHAKPACARREHARESGDT